MSLTIHCKYKYFDSTVQRAEDRRQKFHFCRLPFAVNVMLNLSNETQQTASTVVVITQIIAELKLFQLIQLIHFDGCIQGDLTIKLIQLIKGRRTLTQFMPANR